MYENGLMIKHYKMYIKRLKFWYSRMNTHEITHAIKVIHVWEVTSYQEDATL